MFKLHSIIETSDGYQGYIEGKFFYFYYLVTPDGGVFYDERFRKAQYQGFVHWKKIIKGFDKECDLFPPIEIANLEHGKLKEIYESRYM